MMGAMGWSRLKKCPKTQRGTVDAVTNGKPDAPGHTLIEADNFEKAVKLENFAERH